MTDSEQAKERQAAINWIRNNTHVAFYYTIVAHEHWHGCDCEIAKMAASEIDAKLLDEFRDAMDEES